jgi:hypothetical protein
VIAMTKIKLRLSPSLLEYCQAMTQSVNDARDEKLRVAAQAKINLEPFADPMIDIPVPEAAGLLTPPRIEMLLPEYYLGDDGMEGIIHISTSAVFGIVSIYVTLKDEAGDLLEKGYAMRDEAYMGYWAFLPSVIPMVGTTVVVRAVALDALGALSVAEEKVTVTDGSLGPSADLVPCSDNR